MSNVRVEMDVNAAVARRASLIKRAQAALDTQVIKDSNYFCPEQEGTLQSSALTVSKVGQGEISWSAPYARNQYYGLPNKSHDKNPNARMKWFEEAKARHLEDWRRIAQENL